MLTSLALVATVALADDKAPRLGHAFSVPEAVFTQSNVYRVTQRLGDGPPVVLLTEAEYRIGWKNVGSRLELRRLEGTVRVSSGEQRASYRYGDPPSADMETIERLFGPPTRGWDFEVEKASGKLTLLAAYGVDGKKRERGDFDEQARAQLEAELREYHDRPGEKGASWRTSEELPLAEGLTMARTFTFTVDGERRHKGARCAVVRVAAGWEQKGKAAGKVVSSTFDREDLFDTDHGFLAKSLIDSTIVLERTLPEGKLTEEQHTEIRWALESVGPR